MSHRISPPLLAAWGEESDRPPQDRTGARKENGGKKKNERKDGRISVQERVLALVNTASAEEHRAP